MTPRGCAGLRPGDLSEVAECIHRRSTERWGNGGQVVLIGRDCALLDAQSRLKRFAVSDAPVLLTGETGTGKELFARSLYLLSGRCGKPFVRVNCAQFHDGSLMASELFGHKRGAFTGAVADHRGLFEEANGGVIFLDEIGELSLPAQAMLLRALSEGEIVPVGGSAVRNVDVRVIAATSRDLRTLVAAGSFREDLFYRLRYLWIRVPALRERGRDWELIARHYLAHLGARSESPKLLSRDAVAMLRGYGWPGNVRELRSLMDMGYHLCDGAEIGPDELADAMEPDRGGSPAPPSPAAHALAHGLAHGFVVSHGQLSVGHGHANGNGHAPPASGGPRFDGQPFHAAPSGLASNGHAADGHAPGAANGHRSAGNGAGNGAVVDPVASAWERMTTGGESFWMVVREPFMERELSRAEVREILRRGLAESSGSYKRLLARIGVAPDDYLKFMDFLRHHRLKPEAYARTVE